MTTKIKALLDHLQASTWSDDYDVFSLLPYPNDCRALAAFEGSIDAARDLHEAMLPMWDAHIKCAADGNPSRAELRPLTPVAANPPLIVEWSKTPARAWLLAILRAADRG